MNTEHISWKSEHYQLRGWRAVTGGTKQPSTRPPEWQKHYQNLRVLTGRSFGSMKNILMMISNSPQPVSVISYGGLVTTAARNRDEGDEPQRDRGEQTPRHNTHLGEDSRSFRAA